jgi:hypothetical protein
MSKGPFSIVRVLTLVVNIAAVGTAVLAGRSLLSLAKGGSQSPQRPRIARSLNIDFSKAKKTLLVVVRRECPFCSSEMTFYTELVARRGTAKKSLQVVVVAPVKDGDISDYLESQRLIADAVVYVRGDELPGVHVTPTLLLTDSTGLVIDTWTGVLAHGERRALLEQLF